MAMATVLLFGLGTAAYASPVPTMETQTVGTKDYNDVYYTGSEFIAAGNGATISTLGLGTMWNGQVYEASGLDFTTAKFGGGSYVAAANKGRLQIGPAPNLLAAPRLIATVAMTVRDLAYSDGKWVAIGDLGLISTSSDQGGTWPRASSLSSDRLNSIAANGNQWMAVGDNGATVKSGDAQMWMLMTKQYPTASFKKIAYMNGHWIAVGSMDGKGIIVSSKSMDQWEVAHIDDKTTGFTSIASMGSQVAVAGDNGRILITSDPAKWEDGANSAWNTGASNLVGIAGTNNTWVAVSNTGQVVYSPSQNINWGVHTELASGGYKKLATGRNIFVAVGTSGQITMIDPLQNTDITLPPDKGIPSILLPGLNKGYPNINIVVDKKAASTDIHISGYNKAPLIW